MSDNPHLLVVDDDARLRSLLQRYLAENGFRVTAAADAQEARAALNVLAFDLLVLDVMMPGETGLELVESLRQQGRDVPVLMLTARGDPDDRVAGFEHGADDYLAKPFDPRELAFRIRTILKRAMPPPLPTTQAGPVQLGQLWFDPDRSELRGPGGATRLTGGRPRCSPPWPAGRARCSRASSSPRRWARPRRGSARWMCRSPGCAAKSSPTRVSRAFCTPSATRAMC